jgi:hypothetical protein
MDLSEFIHKSKKFLKLEFFHCIFHKSMPIWQCQKRGKCPLILICYEHAWNCEKIEGTRQNAAELQWMQKSGNKPTAQYGKEEK